MTKLPIVRVVTIQSPRPLIVGVAVATSRIVTTATRITIVVIASFPFVRSCVVLIALNYMKHTLRQERSK